VQKLEGEWDGNGLLEVCGALGIRDRKGGYCLAKNVNRRHGRHMCMVLRGHLFMVTVF